MNHSIKWSIKNSNNDTIANQTSISKTELVQGN